MCNLGGAALAPPRGCPPESVHAIQAEVTLWPIPNEGGDAVKSVKSTRLSVVNKVLLGILGITGTVLVLLTTSHYGAGLSTDSVAYIATARNIAHGLGATSLDGNPLVLQAPFYSLLLACIDRLFGVDPLSSAPVVNAVILGLLVYVSGSLISRHLTQGYVYALLGAAAVLLSPALFGVSVMAWSEPLFVLFAVLFLLFLESWLQNKDRAWFAIFTLSAALACITRYAGVTLILTGGLAILLLDRERWKARIVHAFVFASISILPVGIWLIRNYAVSGTFLGPRAPAMFGLSRILKFAFDTLVSWYLPGAILKHPSILFLVGAGIGFLAGFHSRGTWARIRTLPAGIAKVAPVLLFLITYLAFMVVSSATTEVSPLESRLMSPIYVPLTLLLLMLADQLLKPFGQRLYPRLASILFAVAIGLWLLYPLSSIQAEVIAGLNQGWGYSGRLWKESPIVQYLQHEPVQTSHTIYSNAPDVLYILVNLSAKTSPAQTAYNSSGLTPLSGPKVNDLSRIGESWPESNDSYLIWFDKIDREYLFTLSDLQSVADFRQTNRFDDGGIYLVSRRQ